MRIVHLVTETGSEEGGRDAALELPSDSGLEAKAGRTNLDKRNVGQFEYGLNLGFTDRQRS